ncbi:MULTISPECIES: minor capsid protein [unclassified Myroides]|uniref:minor capsid protein n=1 Tax=unclassified Myroides TaxID=2642485 RepID=UPI003D2F8DC9
MAKEWMDVIKGMYKAKGVPENFVSTPIVQKQGQEFNKAINSQFGDIDFNSPDYILRETLKKNTWDFSVAKNYTDNIRLNNLLLNEDGSLRSWSDFKYEAKKVVGESTRYLKTEYDTVVASAQMSRIWQDLQATKEIFPYVQMVVVKDDRTSDTCTPLADVIFSVDDPALIYYWPPNHFNCRTTIKKLRYGVPTEKYELPEIPQEFRNNAGATGEVFTKDNSYIANTPQEILKQGRELFEQDKIQSRYDDIPFNSQSYNNNGVLEIFTKGKQFKHEQAKNIKTLEILCNLGKKYRLLPVIEDGLTNPDALNLITNKLVDIKVADGTNGKNIIQGAMKEASRQKVSEVIINLNNTPNSYREMYLGLRTTLLAKRAKNIKNIIIIFPDRTVKEYDVETILAKITKR